MTDASLVERASVGDEALAILSRLGVPQSAFARAGLPASSPITGELITHVGITSADEDDEKMTIGDVQREYPKLVSKVQAILDKKKT